MSVLRDAFHRAADLIVDALEEAAAPEWIDQHKSPLGKRRHLNAVREGRLPGTKDGNLVLVKRSDMEAFLAKHKVKPTVKAEALSEDESIERAAERALREIRRVG